MKIELTEDTPAGLYDLTPSETPEPGPDPEPGDCNCEMKVAR